MKYKNEYFEQELRKAVKERMLDTFLDREQFANRYNVTRLETQLREHNNYSEADIAMIEVNGLNDATIFLQNKYKELI